MNRLIPNAITVAALCAGLSGIRFAMDGRWEWAVTAIVVAAILDGLDGRMARLLNGTSKFGAELDSLSDFVAFGVAPALIVYMWVLNAWGAAGWIICLAYAVCMALRLARFNTMLADPNPPKWQGHFFVGVPAPAGAGLALLPLMLHFQAGDGWFDRPAIGAATMALVAFLMVSRIPTFRARSCICRADGWSRGSSRRAARGPPRPRASGAGRRRPRGSPPNRRSPKSPESPTA
ncbi:MAG: CDP-diacylglycerol--serine O-phosphatidyltransferase, partial [Tagaea sp.]